MGTVNPNDPTIVAARINYRGTIIAAAIGAAGVILAALIALGPTHTTARQTTPPAPLINNVQPVTP